MKPGLAKETLIAAGAGAGIAGYLGLWLAGSPGAVWALYFVFACGIPLLVDLLRRVAAREFGSDLLAGLSIVTALLLGEYLAGAIVILMLSGGAALEQYATRRASSVLEALASRMPRIAHRRGGSGVEDVALDTVAIGDVLVVLPHEVCPVDGTVVEGRGSMDESYLTGEPYVISKAPGAAVLSGAINGESALTVTVGKLPVDSRYARIMRVMREAERNRPRVRRIGDRLGAWYTVLALGVAGGSWLLSGEETRFLAVLVIATPCPLLLGIPVAIVGAISLAARRAIIVKNPSMLERIDRCRTVIFDKTGTLTYGRPALTAVETAGGVSRSEALRLAASLEQYSRHPLSAPILEAARAKGIEPASVLEIAEKPGAGLAGRIDGRHVRITGRIGVAGVPPPEPGMECVLEVDGAFAALFRFRDEPRRDSHAFVRHLNPRHGVVRIMLLSGDREAEVRFLAAEVGIAEALHGKSPEEKLSIVRAESARVPTLFLGDGVNDAPAMQAATVSVAFGRHDDITAEAADAVILDASLARVDELIHIGRRMRVIALQSAVGGMALSMIGMGFAAAGYLPPVAGAVLQEVIDLAAVVNSLRVAMPTNDLQDL